MENFENLGTPDEYVTHVWDNMEKTDVQMPNPIATAFMKFCIGNTSERAVMAFSPIFATKKLSMILYRESHSNYFVVLVDRSIEISTLRRLIITFLITFVILMALLSLLSIFLARWTVKPIAKAWEKQKRFKVIRPYLQM